MRHLSATFAVAVGGALAALLLVAGCGGGSDHGDDLSGAHAAGANAASVETPDTVDSSDDAAALAAQADASEAPLAHALSYTVVTSEILQNGQFTSGSTAWTLQDAALASSALRAGGKALNIGWMASQTLAGTAIQAGKSYTLIVKARADRAGGTSQISMRFRKPKYSESIRTYKVTVSSTSYQDYRIDFTAPPYTAMADVSIVAANARVIVDSASLKMRSAIPQTEPITFSAGSYVPAGYTLAFNDEFTGGSLKRSKWFTRYIFGGETQDHLNDEQQRYRDNNNHVVISGVLKLMARKVRSNDPAGVNYESGMIRSDWTTRYGYFEARVKMPGGIGAWPAFWLNSDVSSDGRQSWPPEIDIFEFVNNGVEDRLNMLHSNVVKQTSTTISTLSFADPAFSTTNSAYYAPFNFNEGWHTIGLEWEPDQVTTYVDGLKIYSRSYQWVYADGTLAGPAHILLNLAIGGAWAGRHGIDDSAFPQALQIDWVRAYKKN